MWITTAATPTARDVGAMRCTFRQHGKLFGAIAFGRFVAEIGLRFSRAMVRGASKPVQYISQMFDFLIGVQWFV